MDDEAGDLLTLVGEVFFEAVEREDPGCRSFDGLADDLDFTGDAEAGAKFNVIIMLHEISY